MTTETLLSILELRKAFTMRGRKDGLRELVAVDGVSFKLRETESLAVVGESGSGKSTLARMIVGLELPSSGEIFVNGRAQRGSLSRKTASRRAWARNVQMVFQDPYSSFDPRQRIDDAISETLDLHFRLTDATRQRRILELLENVGLDAERSACRPGRLSGGERQRAALARALAIEPKILILDEAVAALDVSIQAQIINLLQELKERTDVAYLFLTHDLAVSRQITDEMIVMRDGRIIERGSTKQVLDRPQQSYTKRLLDSVPRPGWTPDPADKLAVREAKQAGPVQTYPGSAS